ncbi:unnamed protein product [Thelazia callipaeda]|uniref:Lactamase_B domain-containing protein n=1 Tax=Thelazia callipaeda TaxID=103827 RepID=A0A0N5D1G6_THECL|nr:unnamed protein product [Thelazia callipaeda]
MVQSSAVRGIFLCGQRPEVGARVKLFEHDYNFANVYKQPNNINAYIAEYLNCNKQTLDISVANHEDLLNETYTDQDGRFFVHGTTIEVEQIKPILKVYHKCLLYGMPGFRKIHFVIPSHFTNYGQYAEKILDLGVFNLEVILPVSIPF